MTRVEFLGGGERYKLELADGFEPLCHGFGLASGLRGRAYAAAQLGAIQARLRLKQSPRLHRLYLDGLAPARRLVHRGRALAGESFATRYAVKRLPLTKRAIGPKRRSAAKPTNSRLGSLERK